MKIDPSQKPFYNKEIQRYWRPCSDHGSQKEASAVKPTPKSVLLKELNFTLISTSTSIIWSVKEIVRQNFGWNYAATFFLDIGA